MEEEIKIKDKSPNITNSKYPGKTTARVALLDPVLLSPIDFGEYPKLTMVVAGDKRRFKEGIVEFIIQDWQDQTPRSYLFNMDVAIWVSRQVYARTINDLEKRALRRKRMMKIYGYFRELFEKVRGYFQK
jgi:hypothetical protein